LATAGWLRTGSPSSKKKMQGDMWRCIASHATPVEHK
jgi:hypothetical protein